MKQFLFKVGIGAGLLLVFVFAYGSFCDFFFNQKENLDLSEKKSWVLAQKNGAYDYAILGSSRAFGVVDMNLLDSLTGLNGINIASNGSGFKDNFLVLHLFLKSNTIKKLFLQVDMGSLNSKVAFSNEFHAFTFLPYWNDLLVRGVLQEKLPKLNNCFTDIFPKGRYFYFNKYFSPKEVIRRGSFSDLSDRYTKTKGGMGGDNLSQPKKEITTYPWPESVDPEDWKYLIEIKEYAESKGIEVVIFTAPRYQDTQETLKPILESLPNTTHYPEAFDETDLSLFQDQGHLNEYGRFIFTRLLARNL